MEAARSEIARSIQLSGLKNDPLVHLMQAVAASLEAQHRLHQASTSHLRDVRDQREWNRVGGRCAVGYDTSFESEGRADDGSEVDDFGRNNRSGRRD